MKFETAQDIIRFAVQQEEAARLFYEKAAELAREPSIKKVFAGLAAEELDHKEQLYRINLAAIDGTSTGMDQLACMEPRPEVPFKAQMTGREILDYAIGVEASTEQLYLSAAKETEVPELKELLVILARAEQSHQEKLISLQAHPSFAQK